MEIDTSGVIGGGQCGEKNSAVKRTRPAASTERSRSLPFARYSKHGLRTAAIVTALLAALVAPGSPAAAEENEPPTNVPDVPGGEPKIAAVVPAGELQQRRVPPKPETSVVPPGYSDRNLHLKLVEGSRARLVNGDLRATGQPAIALLNRTLAQFPGTTLQRMFSRPEAVLDAEKARIEARSGRQQADKNLWFRVQLADELDAIEVMDALNALDIVEIAYAEPLPAPLPITPNFEPLQLYLDAPTNGIDADYAKTVAGGRGDNVKIIDIEYAWNQNHEDLSKAVGANIDNGTPCPLGNDNNHGTAVLGELIADDNGIGVTGIVPDASIGMVNTARLEGADCVVRVAEAIDHAHDNLVAGDIILLELQVRGPDPTCTGDGAPNGYVALEWIAAWYDAIVSATSDGILVVEAAGNGSCDYDSGFYGSTFPQDRPDSGAIIVGAGTAPGGTAPRLGRLGFSSHGTRVDLQGPGELVFTTGYGTYQTGPVNEWYRSDFSGTSSASPVVAGAAAALSSIAQERGLLLSPTQIRSILKTTGIPQDTSAAGALPGNIGPLPDLQAAIGAIPSCPADDSFEPNDLQAEAAGLSTGFIELGITCDDDWYLIPAAAGTTINVSAVFSHSTGDVDITLHDPTGLQVASSLSGTDDEEIGPYVATMAGAYAVRVYGYLGAQNIYDLSVAVTDFAGSSGLVVLSTPCVVYDTDAAGESAFVGGETREVQVTGALSGQGGASSCVPAGASSVVFTISSIDPLTEGNLLLTPANVPATGSAGVVNYGAVNGLNNANTVTVPVSALGAVDLGANAGPLGAVQTTDVRLVAVGFYSPDVDPDLKFFPLNPCAVADTRTNQSASDVFDGPNNDGLWPMGSAFPDIDVVGVFPAGQGGGNTDCGVPASADAVMVNVVAVNMEGGSGHLSVGTGGTDPINEAATPFAVLSPKMNNGATTIVRLDASETVAIDVDGDVGASTMIRVEILGYYDNDVAGLDFVDVTPCAVFDTRTNQGATGTFAGERQHGAANTTTYQISGGSVPVGQGGIVDAGGGTGTCGVPDDAEAVLINLEAVNALIEGNFWVSAAGETTTGGVLNFNNVTPKMNNANAVVVPLSTAGQLDLEINAGNFTPVGTDVAHARGIILGFYK